MKMADNEQPDPDSRLEPFFRAARQQQPTLSDDLTARMLADAAAVQAERAHPPAPGPGLLAQLRDALGGWVGLGGLVTAGAAGIWIGFSPPDFLPDPADLVYWQDSDPFAEDGLSGLLTEEG